MLITLVRHAEIDHDYLSCYNGHIDISLSYRGLKQAVRLSEHFQGISFDAVYASDLQQARETVAALDLSVEPQFTKQLREKSWGRHEGKTFDQVMMMEKKAYESFDQWINLLDGEPMERLFERVRHFFKTYLIAQGYDHVLVVTHAGVIRSLMTEMRGISVEEGFTLQFGYANYVTVDTANWKCGPIVSPD